MGGLGPVRSRPPYVRATCSGSARGSTDLAQPELVASTGAVDFLLFQVRPGWKGRKDLRPFPYMSGARGRPDARADCLLFQTSHTLE